MNDSIRRSRLGTEDGWPRLQYLWDVHPIVDWLADRVSSVFGRGSAPVCRLQRLQADEAAFVFNGLVPNLKGHPLVDEWPVVLFKDGKFQGVKSAARLPRPRRRRRRTVAERGGRGHHRPCSFDRKGRPPRPGLRRCREKAIRRPNDRRIAGARREAACPPGQASASNR